MGGDCEITRDPEKILRAERIILPGVGAFGAAMADLYKLELTNSIRASAKRGVPLLGICLGMQMLADYGEEFGVNKGLGLIQGAVKRLPDWNEKADDKTRIPNVGWRRISHDLRDKHFSSLPNPSWFYFVHSFYFHPDKFENVLATVPVNGANVAALVRHRNVIGCQFHPEKSGNDGLEFLRGFINLER